MSMRVDPITGRVTYLGTGIGDLAAAKKDLRRRFGQRPLEPVQVRPGAYFYVTIRAGSRSARLAGPYVSHMTALTKVPEIQRRAMQARPDDCAFAAFGTASIPGRPRKTRFGR